MHSERIDELAEALQAVTTVFGPVVVLPELPHSQPQPRSAAVGESRVHDIRGAAA